MVAFPEERTTERGLASVARVSPAAGGFSAQIAGNEVRIPGGAVVRLFFFFTGKRKRGEHLAQFARHDVQFVRKAGKFPSCRGQQNAKFVHGVFAQFFQRPPECRAFQRGKQPVGELFRNPQPREETQRTVKCQLSLRADVRGEQKERTRRAHRETVRQELFETFRPCPYRTERKGGQRAETQRAQRGGQLHYPGRARHLKIRFIMEDGAIAVE